jgi:serine protease Do
VAAGLTAEGRIRRSWLGIDVQPLFKHSQQQHGVLISGVLDHSPAADAGMAPGDLLLRLNGTATDVRFDEQLPDFMRLTTGLPIGKEVTARIERDGKERTVRLVPVERGEMNPQQQELKAWGLTARNISSLVAREMKRESLEGVLVTSVRPGGPAGEAKPPLEPKDVLIEVNGTAVTNLEELTGLTRSLTDGQADPVPVIATFERKAARYMAVVKVGIQELKDPGLEVTKAWLPVETQAVSREIARQLGDPALKGFYVTRVYAGTTAARAGLKPGDFIVAVDDEKLMASGPEYADELTSLIREYDIGKTVELTVVRGKARIKVPVELARSPRLQREMKKYRNDDFEFTARNVSFFDDADEQWDPDQGGALVEEVKSGSWAELGSLDVGDLVQEVDGHAVANVDDLRRQLEQTAAARRTVVVLKVLRGIHSLYLELEPNWKS